MHTRADMRAEHGAHTERVYYRWMPVGHWGVLPAAVQSLYFELHGYRALVRTIRGVRVASYVDGVPKYVQSAPEPQVAAAIASGRLEELAGKMIVLKTLDSANPEVELVECLFDASPTFIHVRELEQSSICARTRRRATMFIYDGEAYRISPTQCKRLSSEWVMRRASPKVIGTVDYVFSGTPSSALRSRIRGCDGYLEDFIIQQTDASVRLLRELGIEPMDEAEAAYYASFIGHAKRSFRTRLHKTLRCPSEQPVDYCSAVQAAVRENCIELTVRDAIVAKRVKDDLRVVNEEAGVLTVLRLPSSLRYVHTHFGMPEVRWSANAMHGDWECLVQRIVDGPARMCVTGGTGTGKLAAMLAALQTLRLMEQLGPTLIHVPNVQSCPAGFAEHIRRVMGDSVKVVLGGSARGEFDIAICYQTRHSSHASYSYNCRRLIVLTNTSLLTPIPLLHELRRHGFPHCSYLTPDSHLYALELLALMSLEGALVETGVGRRTARLVPAGMEQNAAERPEIPATGARAHTYSLLREEAEAKRPSATLPFYDSNSIPAAIPEAEIEVSSPFFSVARFCRLLESSTVPALTVHVRVQTGLDAHAVFSCQKDCESLNAVYGVQGAWDSAFEYPKMISGALRSLIASLCE